MAKPRGGAVTLGMLMLGAAWLGPLPAMAVQSFSAHMAMHMTVVAIAAPLIAMGVAGSACDPARRWPDWFAPVPASIIELVVVWGWHAPLLHLAARHSVGWLALEQSTFFSAGLFLWLSARGGPGVFALLFTSMHMTLLGALFALAPRILYAHAGGVAGISTLADQQLGGAIMLLVGGVSYLAGGLWLTAGLLRETKGSMAFSETS